GRIDGFTSLAFKKMAKIIDTLWQQGSQLDALWANPDPTLWRWKERAMDRLSKETMSVLMADKASFLRATQVRHLLKPPWYAATPKVVAKLIWRLMHFPQTTNLPVEHPIIDISAQQLQE
ncbi:MAG: hypothetical protein GY943_10575, partial [Chloroflexi bacterium]|nr:hypothetical protein [Chloroflexota bacterium]